MRKGIEKLRASKRRDATKEWLETDLLIRFDGRIVEITVEIARARPLLMVRKQTLEKVQAQLGPAAFQAALDEGQHPILKRRPR